MVYLVLEHNEGHCPHMDKRGRPGFSDVGSTEMNRERVAGGKRTEESFRQRSSCKKSNQGSRKREACCRM